MATIAIPYDHARDPMNPGDLGSKISAALNLTSDPKVDIDPANVVVTHPAISSANTAAIQAVIAAYTLDPVRAALPEGNLGTLLARAQQALTANATFLAIPSPNATQVGAQVQTLTKECSAVIRVLVNALDSTAGT